LRRRRKSSGFLAVLRFVLAFPALPEYRPNPMACRVRLPERAC
jgi:hypothetical protein